MRLTKAGSAERAELDRRSDAVAAGFLEPLSDGQRARLPSAMAEVERLLNASLVEVVIEEPTTPDARWCFDPSISISADAAELTAPAGLLLLARIRGQAVGCGALKLHADALTEAINRYRRSGLVATRTSSSPRER